MAGNGYLRTKNMDIVLRLYLLTVYLPVYPQTTLCFLSLSKLFPFHSLSQVSGFDFETQYIFFNFLQFENTNPSILSTVSGITISLILVLWNAPGSMTFNPAFKVTNCSFEQSINAHSFIFLNCARYWYFFYCGSIEGWAPYCF